MELAPSLRLVPATTATKAGDPSAPSAVYISTDIETVILASVAVGLGMERVDGTIRVAGTAADLEMFAAELERRGSVVASQLRQALSPARSWRLRTRTLSVREPLVMGIVNLTTDSFSGDGVGTERDNALARAAELRRAGADIIDVGGESARANRPVLASEEEAFVVAPVIEALVREGHCVSVDTYKAEVAAAALDAGAEIVNDISGLTAGTGAAEAAARHGAGYVLNYSFSPPKRRPDTPPAYEDVTIATLRWFEDRLQQLVALRVETDQIVIDPGIAFGKSHDEDLAVLRRLGEFQTFGRPVLLAHSRKNYIGSITGGSPDERDLETHVTSAFAFERGARIFRVHDVAGTVRALRIAGAFEAAPGTYAPGAGSWPWRAGADAAHATTGDSTVSAPEGQRW